MSSSANELVVCGRQEDDAVSTYAAPASGFAIHCAPWRLQASGSGHTCPDDSTKLFEDDETPAV